MSHPAGPGSGPETLGSDPPRLTDRWTALPRRTRLTVLTATALVLAASGGSYLLLHRPEPPAASPTPYPALVTRIEYRGLTGPVPGSQDFTVRLEGSTTDDAPVTVEGAAQGYSALTIELLPHAPIVLEASRPRRFSLHVEVHSCADLPLDARLPFFDVTLRNSRAIQNLSVIPGDTYTRELSRALRTICEPPTAARAPR